MSEWIVLLPSGSTVEIVRDSPAVDVATLVSKEQIMALAEAAATMKLAGIPVEVGDLLRRLVRPDLSEPLFDAAPYKVTDTPPAPRAAEFPCSCGRIYGDQAMLTAHLQANPSHDLSWLPPEHRVD